MSFLVGILSFMVLGIFDFYGFKFWELEVRVVGFMEFYFVI